MKSRAWMSLLILVALTATACGGSDAGEQAGADVASEAPAEVVEPTEVADEPGVEPSTEVDSDPTPTQVVADEPTSEPEESEPTDEPEESEVQEPELDETDDAAVDGCGSGVAPGITTVSFEFDGVDRVYEQVVPTAYDDASSVPVVLNWHGLGSNGVEQVGFSDYAALAEAEGFVVIAPTGLPDESDRNSWELAPEQFPERDDLAFANALLDRVIETLCVDESRVYTTGMSNGGYFSSVLICEMADRIAAASSVAALSHPDDCEPSRIVPYIGFHGTNDEVVPFDGSGESSLAPGVVVPLFQLKILDEFTEFAVQAGCDPEPVVADFSETVTSYDFANCDAGAAMTFYEIEGGGHTWPGSAVSLALSEALGLGVTTDEIDASATSWAFFEQYSLDS